jgi:hypothetical protein
MQRKLKKLLRFASHGPLFYCIMTMYHFLSFFLDFLQDNNDSATVHLLCYGTRCESVKVRIFLHICMHFYFFGGIEFVSQKSLAFIVHFVFLRDVSFRTQRAAVGRRRATNYLSPYLATHLPS